MSPGEFSAKWSGEGRLMKQRGALVNGAALIEEVLDDFIEVTRTSAQEQLNLTDAAAESGYSPDHLGRLVKRGLIRNSGRPNAPRILRSDLPRKPGGLPPASRTHHLMGASPGQIARAVVTSDTGAKR